MNVPFSPRGLCGCLLAWLFLLLLPASGTTQQTAEKNQPKAKSTKLTRAQILEILNEEIDLTPFQIPMKFSEAMGLLQEQVKDKKGLNLPIFIDSIAFQVLVPDAPPVSESQLKFPAKLQRGTFADVLNSALDQVPTRNAAFIVRKGKLEITTDSKAQPENLMDQKVFGVFKNKPLAEALEEFSEQTGINIVVDPKVQDKLKTPVTAIFGANSSLEAAVPILSNMVGVESLFLRDVIYITSEENAKKLGPLQKQLQGISNFQKKTLVGPQFPWLPGN